MNVKEARYRIQSAYPRIYLACHSRHQHARTSASALSQRDASLLAHLSESAAATQQELAKHMGLSKSTLSEALSELERLGYVKREPQPKPAKTIGVTRTRKGSAAMSGGSVLESQRLDTLLRSLKPADREAAVRGMEVLAQATSRGRVGGSKA